MPGDGSPVARGGGLEGDPGSPRIGDRFLEWRAVKVLTGLSRTTAWRRQKAGDFPAPRQISPGRVGWLESEVSAWQASRAPPGQADLPAFNPSPKPKPPRFAAPSRPPFQPVSPPGPVRMTPPAAATSPRRRARPRPFDEAQGAFDF